MRFLQGEMLVPIAGKYSEYTIPTCHTCELQLDDVTNGGQESLSRQVNGNGFVGGSCACG